MKKLIIVACAALILSACSVKNHGQQNHANRTESPNEEHLAKKANTELHIVSPGGGAIRIGSLEIGDDKQPMVARTDRHDHAQCPFSIDPAAPSPATDREAGTAATLDSGGDVEDGAVGEQEERVDAAPAVEHPDTAGQKGRLPGRLPE